MSKERVLSDDESTARTALPVAMRIMPIAYRVDDAAFALGVSESTVWKLIRAGKLPARRLGRATLIRRLDLSTYANSLPPVDVKAAQ